MAEYVNREEALEILSSRTAPWNGYQKVRDLPSADVVERTLFDERMAEYQEALDKANEKLACITGTDDYHYDLEYGREQLNSYVSALVYEKTQERKKGKWIPVTSRPMDEEERAEWSAKIGYDIEDEDAIIYTSQMPDDGEEVLTCDRYGNVSIDTFNNDPDCGCYFEDNGDMDGIVAWMPKPKPYKPPKEES